MQPSDLYNLLCSSSYRKVGDDVDYSIVYDQDENMVRLMFIGSTTKRDWVNDFRFPAKLYKKQENWFLVHRGFGDAWQSARDDVMNDLQESMLLVESFGAKVQIIGHSLGGAFAQLAAEDYMYQFGHQVDEVVTFGSPKPIFGLLSKKHFKKAAKKWSQYRYSWDIVPWAPPFLGYHNVSSHIIDKKNAWKLWRVFNTVYWHLHYGDSSFYY